MRHAMLDHRLGFRASFDARSLTRTAELFCAIYRHWEPQWSQTMTLNPK